MNKASESARRKLDDQLRYQLFATLLQQRSFALSARLAFRLNSQFGSDFWDRQHHQLYSQLCPEIRKDLL